MASDTQRSHLKAVASIHDLKQNDLSLRIAQTDKSGHSDITLINTNQNPGLLLTQLNSISQVIKLLLLFIFTFITLRCNFCIAIDIILYLILFSNTILYIPFHTIEYFLFLFI